MVELEDFETFVAIVDRGSMRGAARARGVTPSLVSRRLSRLEERLGVVLVVRTTRSLSLTDAGRRFEGYAREILSRVTDALDDMQGRGTEPRGVLRIAASYVYGTERVAPILADFLDMHSKVQAELVLDDVRADLIGHGFDAAIRIGTLADSELIARPLEPYLMGLFAAPAYLAREGVPASASELRRHHAVELGAAAGRPWRLLGPDGETKVRPRRRALASSGHALLRMAEQGAGIIAQPLLLVGPSLASGRLVPVLPDHELPSRMVHVLYRRSPFLPAHLRAFVDHLVARMQRSPQTRPTAERPR